MKKLTLALINGVKNELARNTDGHEYICDDKLTLTKDSSTCRFTVTGHDNEGKFFRGTVHLTTDALEEGFHYRTAANDDLLVGFTSMNFMTNYGRRYKSFDVKGIVKDLKASMKRTMDIRTSMLNKK